MKTAVTETSLEAFHTLTDKARQTARIARYLIEETKHARWGWIGKVSRHFHIQTSSVAGRMNELKAHGIRLDGRLYEMKKMGTVKDAVTGKTVEAWALVQVVPDGVQGELFISQSN